jgi:hypothetical protein
MLVITHPAAADGISTSSSGPMTGCLDPHSQHQFVPPVPRMPKWAHSP